LLAGVPALPNALSKPAPDEGDAVGSGGGAAGIVPCAGGALATVSARVSVTGAGAVAGDGGSAGVV
jgi:hypothetical protein